MAEFQEVMRQRERICLTSEEDCSNCPLDVFGECLNPTTERLQEYEEIITKWASEHPEAQYPSWEEWQEADYPNARFPISLCHFIKGSICPRPMNPLLGSCVECRKQPIPADIAEKLHIPPKGAKE